MNNFRDKAKNAKLSTNSAIDIAYWITVRLITKKLVPSVDAIQNLYGISRAGAYRWHAWAKNKHSELLA